MTAVIKQTDRAKRGDASNPVRPGGPGIAAGGPTHVPTSAQVAAPAEVTSAHVPAAVPATSAVLRVRERRKRQSKQEGKEDAEAIPDKRFHESPPERQSVGD